MIHPTALPLINEGGYISTTQPVLTLASTHQDVVISSDGQFALSGSWDGTLRLWDLNTGSTTRRFVGHAKDVLSVAFSVDNRQVRYALKTPLCLMCSIGQCPSVMCICGQQSTSCCLGQPTAQMHREQAWIEASKESYRFLSVDTGTPSAGGSKFDNEVVESRCLI